MKTKNKQVLIAAALAFTTTVVRAADLVGSVQGAGKPIAGSTLTLFAAGTGAPTQLAQGKTDDAARTYKELVDRKARPTNRAAST